MSFKLLSDNTFIGINSPLNNTFLLISFTSTNEYNFLSSLLFLGTTWIYFLSCNVFIIFEILLVDLASKSSKYLFLILQ